MTADWVEAGAYKGQRVTVVVTTAAVSGAVARQSSWRLAAMASSVSTLLALLQ